MSEGDNDNKIYISADQLLVIRKQKRRTFLLSELAALKTETKKMLFPLITGGILTPFSFLSFFVNLSLPWLHLISILGGMLLFYLGWTGKTVLTLAFKNGEELNFYLPSISKNLEAFIDFANFSLRQHSIGNLGMLLYFDLQDEEIEQFFGAKIDGAGDLFPVFGYTYQQIVLAKNSLSKLTAIDPGKTGVEIKFSYHLKSNLMRPVIDQPVLAESRVTTSGPGSE